MLDETHITTSTEYSNTKITDIFGVCPSSELLLREKLRLLDKGSVISKDALKVDLEHTLGTGCFGKVLQGKLTLASGKEQLVAVKTLKEEVTHQDKRRFLDEAVVME